jgi:hypothetical protein
VTRSVDRYGKARADDPPRVNPAVNLIEEKFFRLLLELQTHQAMRLQYSVSLVCIAIQNGMQEDGGEFLRHVAELYPPQLRLTDVVTVFPPDSIGLLLVNADTYQLPRIVDRVNEVFAAGRVSFGGEERPLRWHAGGASYPRTANSGKELLRQATTLMARARESGEARLLLPT